MNRRDFIKKTSTAMGAYAISPTLERPKTMQSIQYPLVDLHVHTTEAFTIDDAIEISKERGVQFGIVEHPAPWAIRNDYDLKAYIEKLKKYPVYIGLQPIELGWSKGFSPELLSQIDYILMDPQRVPMRNGERLSIWKYDTYIEDTNEFMDRYMGYTMQILENEPLKVFAWPLFLPVCIAKDYYDLWTEERMTQIISVTKERNIAIEINDMSHTPHKDFIDMAKKNGLKFTFGSDARNRNAGRLSFCKRIAEKCNLTSSDFYVPRSRRSAGIAQEKPDM